MIGGGAIRALKARFGDVGRGALLVFALQGAGALLAYGLEIILARVLGPETYGAYSWVMSWVILLGLPATLGLHHAVVRFIPEYQEKERWRALRGLITGSWALVVGGGIAVGAIAYLVMTLSAGADAIYTAAAVALGMSMVPVRSSLELQLNIARSFEDILVGYSPLTVLRPLLLGVTILVLASLSGLDVDLMTALWATAGVFVGLSVLQGLVIWRSLPSQIREARSSFEVPDWLKVSIPLALAGAAFLAIERTDVIMMGVFAEAGDVGKYHAASRTASVVGYVVFSLNAMAGPRMARYHASSDETKLQRLATGISRWGLAGTALFGTALMILADPIMSLFGEGFVGMTGILALLVGAHVFSASVGSVGYLLNMTGYHMTSARAVGLVALINIGLNAVLIPVMGAEGAALATAVAVVLWNLVLRYYVVRALRVEPSILHDLRRLLANSERNA